MSSNDVQCQVCLFLEQETREEPFGPFVRSNLIAPGKIFISSESRLNDDDCLVQRKTSASAAAAAVAVASAVHFIRSEQTEKIECLLKVTPMMRTQSIVSPSVFDLNHSNVAKRVHFVDSKVT